MDSWRRNRSGDVEIYVSAVRRQQKLANIKRQIDVLASCFAADQLRDLIFPTGQRTIANAELGTLPTKHEQLFPTQQQTSVSIYGS